MAHRSSKNNIIAGVFLVGSLVLALAISFWLGEISDRLGSKSSYVVRFPMTVGVAGLQPGSKVKLAGMEVGRVLEVRRVEENDRIAHMEAQIAIDAAVSLFDDAAAYLQEPILGGVSAINISSVGNSGTALAEGGFMMGGVAPGLLAQMGFGATEADQIRQIVANIEQITVDAGTLSKRIDRIAASVEIDAEGSATDLRGVLADLKAFSANLTGDDSWESRIEGILGDVQAETAKLPELTETLDRTLANADSTVLEARGLLEDNRAGIGRIVDDTEAITANIRTTSLLKFDDLLDRGVLALASYNRLGDRLNLAVSREYPQIRRTISNVRETSDQAKLALSEFRSQPWRLLSAPSGDELAKEPLYAAARAYAIAVADLRAASEALETAVGSAEDRNLAADGTALLPGASDIAGMARDVDAAFERYRSAEDSLLGLLGSE